MSSPAPPNPPGALRRLWLHVRSFAARLFRREIAPGRFETGRASSLHGTLTTAPLVPAARDYLVYVPRGHSRLRRAPLIVLCHGCRETPEDVAGLTRVTERADREGWLVL
jgi:poly(3-hydroxybutyrate) depolymerase